MQSILTNAERNNLLNWTGTNSTTAIVTPGTAVRDNIRNTLNAIRGRDINGFNAIVRRAVGRGGPMPRPPRLSTWDMQAPGTSHQDAMLLNKAWLMSQVDITVRHRIMAGNVGFLEVRIAPLRYNTMRSWNAILQQMHDMMWVLESLQWFRNFTRTRVVGQGRRTYETGHIRANVIVHTTDHFPTAVPATAGDPIGPNSGAGLPGLPNIEPERLVITTAGGRIDNTFSSGMHQMTRSKWLQPLMQALEQTLQNNNMNSGGAGLAGGVTSYVMYRMIFVNTGAPVGGGAVNVVNVGPGANAFFQGNTREPIGNRPALPVPGPLHPIDMNEIVYQASMNLQVGGTDCFMRALEHSRHKLSRDIEAEDLMKYDQGASRAHRLTLARKYGVHILIWKKIGDDYVVIERVRNVAEIRHLPVVYMEATDIRGRWHVEGKSELPDYRGGSFWPCDRCGYIFAKQSAWSYHRKQKICLTCGICAATFNIWEDLRTHRREECTGTIREANAVWMKQKRAKTNIDNRCAMIFYDLETVLYEPDGHGGTYQKPYCACWLDLSKRSDLVTAEVAFDSGRPEDYEVMADTCGYSYGPNCVLEFVKYLLRRDEEMAAEESTAVAKTGKPQKLREVIVYAHNASKFDLFFVARTLLACGKSIDHIIRHQGRLVMLAMGRYRFQDTYKMLSSSLDRLAKSFGLPIAKGSFPTVLVKNMDMIYHTGKHLKRLHREENGCYDMEDLDEEERSDSWSLEESCIRYCKGDVVLLASIWLKYWKKNLDASYRGKNIGYNILECLTAPALAAKIYFSHFMPAKQLYHLSAEMRAYCAEAKFGGRVSVFVREWNREKWLSSIDAKDKPEDWGVYYVDVNSEYPATMRQDLPIGTPKYRTDVTLDEIVEQKFWGYIRVDVLCPNNLLYPVLPERKLVPFDELSIEQQERKKRKIVYDEAKNPSWKETISNQQYDKLIFDLHPKKGKVYWCEELYLALDMGYTVSRVIDGLEFERGKVMKDFIDCYGAMKQDAKERGDECMATLAKSMMNSSYGRLIMHLDMNASKISRLEKYDKLAEDDLRREMDCLKRVEFLDISAERDVCEGAIRDNMELVGDMEDGMKTAGTMTHLLGEYMTSDEDVDRMASATNYAIGAAIPAKSRVWLYGIFRWVMDKGGMILYCDTDSAVYLGPPLDHEMRSESEIGKWKDELYDKKRDQTGIVTDFVGLLPKCYALRTRYDAKEGHELKYAEIVKAKGISIKGNKGGDIMDLDAMKEILRDGAWKKSIRDSIEVLSNFVLRSVVRHRCLTNRFDKRIECDNGVNTIPFGYVPTQEQLEYGWGYSNMQSEVEEYHDLVDRSHNIEDEIEDEIEEDISDRLHRRKRQRMD